MITKTKLTHSLFLTLTDSQYIFTDISITTSVAMDGQHDGPPSHFTRIVSGQATMIAVGFCLSLSILLAVSPIFVYYYVDMPSRNDVKLSRFIHRQPGVVVAHSNAVNVP